MQSDVAFNLRVPNEYNTGAKVLLSIMFILFPPFSCLAIPALPSENNPKPLITLGVKSHSGSLSLLSTSLSSGKCVREGFGAIVLGFRVPSKEFEICNFEILKF